MIKFDCRNDKENVKLVVLMKMANYPQVRSFVHLELKQEEDKTMELIPFKGDYKIRNQEYQAEGKEWELQYYGGAKQEGGKFWIQIKGIKTQ